MPKILDRAVRLTLALIVAGGLGFGVSTAVASSQSAWPCPDEPGSGRIPVSCSTHAACEGPCESTFGPESDGSCIKSCCICTI